MRYAYVEKEYLSRILDQLELHMSRSPSLPCYRAQKWRRTVKAMKAYHPSNAPP